MAFSDEVILKFTVHKYSSYSSNYYPEYAFSVNIYVEDKRADVKLSASAVLQRKLLDTYIRPHDHSYYAVFRKLRMAGAAVNCVMWMWKVAFCACYRNLSVAATCV